MKPFRVADDYVEVSAVPDRGMTEIYITWPGSDKALSAHIPEKLAWRLGLWMLAWWLWDRLCGWKTHKEDKKFRKLLLELKEEELID